MSARVRKAWFVKARQADEGETIFAPTAGKARYMLLLRLWDVGWDDVTFADLTARRARYADAILPPPDLVTVDLSKEERKVLLHAFGFHEHEPEKAGYRNHYCTTPDDPPLVRLKELGLMERAGQGTAGDGLVYFLLTAAGRHAALSLTPEYAP